jgi:hypothetical protein
MRKTFAQQTWGGVVHMVCSALLTGLFATSAFATETWVEEIWKMVAFEKAAYPQSNFDPYFEKLTVIRNGVERNDQRLVKQEVDRFLKMLAGRAHGIHDVAADEIYNFVLVIKPMDEPTASMPTELRFVGDQARNVSNSLTKMSYENDRPCQINGGCDYWRDDVYDPGAS